MTPLHRFAAVAVLASTLALAPAAQAHRMWIVPSATVLSGDDPWVTFDAAVSNDLFYADHVPMQLQTVTVTGPDGVTVQLQNGATGKNRSTFDVQLNKPGTYRVANVGETLGASYQLNGQAKRWRGSAAELASAIPAGAQNVKVTHNQRRVETFVTRGAPTPVKATGVGLEMEPITHPNDLVAGEEASFRLLQDGKPAAGVEVEIVPGAARYRDAPGDSKATTGADGVFKVTWPAAGMYWIEAVRRGGPSPVPNAERSMMYVATLEVLGG